MNRLLLLVAALAATVGCDDPTVRDRIDNVLDHGITQAEVVCEVDAASSNINHTCGGFSALKLKFDLLQDESVIMSVVGNNIRVTEFKKRGDSIQLCDRFVSGVEADVCISIDSEELLLESTAPCSPNVSSPPPYTETRSVSTYCTGFNLEAFD